MDTAPDPLSGGDGRRRPVPIAGATQPVLHPDDPATARMRDVITRTRAGMGETLEELHGRLNPAVLKDQAMEQIVELKEQAMDQLHEAKETIKTEFKEVRDFIKSEVRTELSNAKAALREATIGKVETMVHRAQDSVKDTSRSLVATVRENPIPVALVGVGLAWMFFGNRRGAARGSAGAERSSRHITGDIYASPGQYAYGADSGHGQVREAISHLGERTSGAARAVTGATSAAAHTIQHAAGDAAHTFQHVAGDAAHTIQHAASTVAHQAGDLAHQAETSIAGAAHAASHKLGELRHSAEVQTQRLGSRIEQTFRDNPLAIGAVVLAVGTAVGLAIPITRREDRMLGAAHDNLMQRAEGLAQDALGRAEDVVDRVGEEVGQALQGNGGAANTRGSGGASPRADSSATGHQQAGGSDHGGAWQRPAAGRASAQAVTQGHGAPPRSTQPQGTQGAAYPMPQAQYTGAPTAGTQRAGTPTASSPTASSPTAGSANAGGAPTLTYGTSAPASGGSSPGGFEAAPAKPTPPSGDGARASAPPGFLAPNARSTNPSH